MKKTILFFIVGMLFLAACAPAGGPSPETNEMITLLVTYGESQQSFEVEDLQALPSSESSFNGVAYQGVLVSDLLVAAGINPNEIKALKAVAADGFTVNYDPAQVLKDDVLVAYALAGGDPMPSEDGSFRMVLPDEEGKLNPRMLAELQVVR